MGQIHIWIVKDEGKPRLLCRSCTATLCRKSELCIPSNETARPRSRFLHSCICDRFIYSQDRSAYLAAAKQAERSWEYINRSQIQECGNWETEHYNSLLEITRLRGCAFSFQVIHKCEPDIYTGFSPALHLQCTVLQWPLWTRKRLE